MIILGMNKVVAEAPMESPYDRIYNPKQSEKDFIECWEEFLAVYNYKLEKHRAKEKLKEEIKELLTLKTKSGKKLKMKKQAKIALAGVCSLLLVGGSIAIAKATEMISVIASNI